MKNIKQKKEKKAEVLCGMCYKATDEESTIEIESHTGATYRVCEECWEREFRVRR